MIELERHPLSALCGDMAAGTYMDLVGDIAAVGVQEPIVLFQGKILDGWHRYRGHRDAQALDPSGYLFMLPRKEFTGTVAEAAALVRRKHLRRDWSESQRGRAAVDLDEYVRNVDGEAAGKSARDLAAEADVSVRTIQAARVVTRQAIPAVRTAVDDGALSLKKAEQVAQLPAREQPAALKEATAPKPRRVQRQDSAPGAEVPRIGVTMEAFKEVEERNAVLVEENDSLTARLAIHFMEGTDEEKDAAAALIADLQKQVQDREAEIRSLKASRDTYMTECTELRRQCTSYRNQLKQRA